jgi:hypothetical protein
MSAPDDMSATTLLEKEAHEGAHPKRPGRAGWSLWSTNSFLSIASKGSFLSIGSIGSACSIGSIGSSFSIGSIGSFCSAFSVLSAWARFSVLSAGSSFAVMSAGARPPAIAGWRGRFGLAAGALLSALGAGSAPVHRSLTRAGTLTTCGCGKWLCPLAKAGRDRLAR